MRAEELKIHSSFGSVAAVINYPKGRTDKLAILCPGYLDSKDYKGLKGLAQTLAKRGYTVVRFEPTGTWGSDGDISRYTTTQYLKDVKNVLEYMLKKSQFNHILLGGHSRGAHISLLYAKRDPRISLVVSIMPSSRRTATDDRDRYKQWKTEGFAVSYRDLPGHKDKRIMFRVPVSHLEDHLKYDVVKDVKKIRVPLILIAGKLDKICPPEEVKKIFDSANEPKKFIVIPKIGHDYRYKGNEVRIVNTEVLKLMKEIGAL